MIIEASCANCKCTGNLVKRNESCDVILVPSYNFGHQEENQEFKRYRKDFFNPHGFETKLQKANYMTLGTLFWVTVMLIANFNSLEENKFKPGIGSYCVREYKKCASEFDWNLCASSMYDCGDIEKENYGSFIFTAPEKIQVSSDVEQSLTVFSYAQNEANENLCLFTAHVSNNICENLCFSSDFSYHPDKDYKFVAADEYSGWIDFQYNQQKNAECKNICMLASDLEVEEDCPFHKRCPNGCPCPGYKCAEDVVDFNVVGVFFDSHDRMDFQTGLYKISLLTESNTIKFEELSWTSYLGNFCIVQFYGDYYVIQQENVTQDKFKLTLHKIDKYGNIELLSVDFVTVQITFGDKTNNKICARGYYTNEEDQIIFCSKYDSRGICHSYAIKDKSVFVREIYNRPQSTVTTYEMNNGLNNGVFGFTFDNQLVCPR